jgi:hypothetical protein
MLAFGLINRVVGRTKVSTGMVGYNVQTAVNTTHHFIVAHEVTNIGNDRSQLANMSEQARQATGIEKLAVVADRGYFSGEEVFACDQAGIAPYVPKPLTSGAKADGRFGKQTSSTCRTRMSTAARLGMQ